MVVCVWVPPRRNRHRGRVWGQQLKLRLSVFVQLQFIANVPVKTTAGSRPTLTHAEARDISTSQVTFVVPGLHKKLAFLLLLFLQSPNSKRCCAARHGMSYDTLL